VLVESAVRVRVPAKVNLHLSVGARRVDGFHELITVFQAVDLHDEVIAEPGSGIELILDGPGTSELPTGDGNLAWQAADLLALHTGVVPDVRLTITKAIPIAGGMAGGSADAAATLLACAQLWQTGTPKEELLSLAGELGSDVPFALTGGTALATGRGELLAPVLSTGEFHWVFAFAGTGISTPAAYAEFDRQHPAPPLPSTPDGVLDALRAGDARRLAAVLHNDLQDAALALVPSLRRTLAAGRELGALAGIVSGSGPTCAFLTPDSRAATKLAAALTADGVCRSATIATGPVVGARVVR
jgi:4-diphosphocytidyl-2-C-methyl-D-erythritol kinase